jgi:hypothetical protein
LIDAVTYLGAILLISKIQGLKLSIVRYFSHESNPLCLQVHTNHLAADSVSTPTENITKCEIPCIVILMTQTHYLNPGSVVMLNRSNRHGRGQVRQVINTICPANMQKGMEL